MRAANARAVIPSFGRALAAVGERVREERGDMSELGFRFREVMHGIVVRAGERFDRPFSFELDVEVPRLWSFLTGTAIAPAAGRLRLDGLAKDVPAEGRLELSPFRRRRLRYIVDFTGNDGVRYRFDGEKETTLRRHVVGWTNLAGDVRARDGAHWGDARLTFSLRHDFGPLARSFAFAFGPAARAEAHVRG